MDEFGLIPQLSYLRTGDLRLELDSHGHNPFLALSFTLTVVTSKFWQVYSAGVYLMLSAAQTVDL